jgi:hypothetical protein
MTVQERYDQFQESVKPKEALLENTRRRMLAEASVDKLRARRRRRRTGRALSYLVACAAGAVLCFAALHVPALTQYLPFDGIAQNGTAAIGQESVVQTQDSASGAVQEGETEQIADVNIYYVENGQLQSETQSLVCTVEDVFAAWAQKNEVADVTVQSVSLDDAGADVMGVRIDFSAQLRDQLDSQGNKLMALSMTLAEYLNADGVVLTAGGKPL